MPLALRYLSASNGSPSVTQPLPDFVPLVSYAERVQYWTWIDDPDEALDDVGQAHLAMLTNHFLATLGGDPEMVPTLLEPLERTTYTVVPSTSVEKESFQRQEHERFASPRRPFTYCLHNYKSVVPPVRMTGADASSKLLVCFCSRSKPFLLFPLLKTAAGEK